MYWLPLGIDRHYSVPYLPFIPSLWTWPKEIIHACVYQRPEDPIFDQKTVAVIGIGSSGYDILRELAILREHDNEGSAGQHKKKLYSVASHPCQLGWDFNDPSAPSWTKLITSVPRFERIEQDKIYLVDGTILEDVDLLCFATGYLYSFPFCRSDDRPWKDHPLTKTLSPSSLSQSNHPAPHQTSNHKLIGGVRVHHLDQTQTFYYPDPSFAFLVLNTQVVPFPLAEYQARAIAARWSGRKNFEIFPMENEEEESRAVHELPPPSEFEVENRLLDQIGEGGAGEGDDGKWGYVPDWKVRLRLDGVERRKRELGY